MQIHKDGAPAAASEQQVKLAPKGAKPGGIIVRSIAVTYTAALTIEMKPN